MDLGWRADGIEKAEAVGGIPLERYRRPGFTGGIGVRRADGQGAGAGIYFDQEPWPDEEEPQDRRRASRLR